ncbi:unnamed protein product [Pleuronectes platessa]|uniref:Uncharacterized protein n=1 Tax=Pleuronectes platessa TaxID=8262 RepID=A0A9N7TH57_PLEPL|nr:unnamed protein product [Pleuronectes platessa]
MPGTTARLETGWPSLTLLDVYPEILTWKPPPPLPPREGAHKQATNPGSPSGGTEGIISWSSESTDADRSRRHGHRHLCPSASSLCPQVAVLLHVVRWGGRWQDRRARPLAAVRGSCCKVLNSALCATGPSHVSPPPVPHPLSPLQGGITSRLKTSTQA